MSAVRYEIGRKGNPVPGILARDMGALSSNPYCTTDFLGYLGQVTKVQILKGI